MDREGNDVGLLKGLQEEGKPVKEASEGKEVAASVDGAVVGRSFVEGDELWVVLTEEGVRQLKGASLTASEQAVLDEVLARHRARQPFWGG
jgi:translation initiation factor IF-2